MAYRKCDARLIRRADHDLTLHQYAAAMMRNWFAANPGSKMTLADYHEHYPLNSRADDHLESIRLACQMGLSIRLAVAHDLARRLPRALLALRHDWPTAFPRGFRMPVR